MIENRFTENDYSLWNECAFEISEQELEEELALFRNRLRRRKSRRSTIMIAAAVAVICISITAGIYAGQHLIPNYIADVEWKEICVNKGAQQEILLPDSSKVILAPGSRLIYPNKFIGKERQVFMNGEVLFDVASDPDCPFRVSVNGTDISVKGTVFNVKAFQEDCMQTITLMQGSIDVTSSISTASLQMTEGCALYIDTRTGNMQMCDISESRYPAWFNGEYNAYNETLAQIAMDLERIYDVEIVIPDKALEKQKFYLSIVKASSIDDVLTVLSRTGKIKISKEDNLIYFN